MKCPVCQTENRDGAKFCDECGHALPQTSESPVGILNEERAALKEIPFASPSIPDSMQTYFDESDTTAPSDPVSEGERDGDQPIGIAAAAGITGGWEPSAEDFDVTWDEESVPKASDPDEDAPFDERALSADKTNDLSGLERLVDASYSPMDDLADDTMEMDAVSGEAPSDGKSYRSDEPGKTRKRSHRRRARRIAVAAAVIVIALGAAAGITYSMELWGGKTVPDVIGDSQANAIYVLQDRGFQVNTTNIKSDDIEGIVLLTDPSQGTRAKDGDKVTIHISVSRAVPDIVGKSKDEAQKLLDEEGFNRVSFVEMKSTEPEGTILACDKEPGTKGKAALPINVIVAVPYRVPDVTGKPVDEARALLSNEEYQYVVNTLTTVSDTVPDGNAVSTNPAVGEQLNPGSEITLYIAQSRENYVIETATNYLSGIGRITYDGVAYEISSVDDVTYSEGNSARFTITARPYEEVDTILFGTQTIYGDYMTLTGIATCNDNHEVESVELL